MRWRIRGRVQGVAYRWFARQQATDLGVSGWVRNRPDGSVEVEARGESEAITRLKRRLVAGPPAARVESIEEEELDMTLPSGTFRIER